jgi:sugar O-acyltransferase (sialic acid O-acetyltransferase NeuD family)
MMTKASLEVTESVAVLGAGDQAMMVASVLIDAGYEIEGFYTDDRAAIGKCILGIAVKGAIADADPRRTPNGIIAIGDNEARKRLSKSVPLNWITAVHPSVVVLPEVEIGIGTIIFPGSVVEFGARIGDHVILNTMSSAAHHCSIGDYAHIVKANVSSHCVVDEGVFMGLQSTLTPGIRVGAWATVGAGAVVIRDVAPNDTVMGVPARPIRKNASA